MNSRDNILKRLRDIKNDKTKIVLPTIKDNQIFKDFPISKDSLYDNFKNRLINLKGELYPVSTFREAANILTELLNTLPGKTCIIQESPFLQEVFSKNAELLNLLQENLSMNSDILAEYEVGVTEVDFLVARTGSILLNSVSGGGRRLSVLPPVHVVIAREEQIVPSLEEALQSYTPSRKSWSYATIITGPSRTSDIEKQLVLGAHGPKRLIVILIRGSS